MACSRGRQAFRLLFLAAFFAVFPLVASAQSVDVWAPDAQVVVYDGDASTPRLMDVPKMRYAVSNAFEMSATDVPDASEWHCASDQLTLRTIRTSMSSVPHAAAPNNASYGLTLAIETDAELWAAFGSDASLVNYIANLIAETSVIYQRDLKTTLTIGTLHIWHDAAKDPWKVVPETGTASALAEFSTYWHDHYAAVNRSTALFISGRLFRGGIAFSDFLCRDDFFCGNDGLDCGSPPFANAYAGGYAFCGSTFVTTTVPDPTLTVSGVEYGAPSSKNYWMLLAVAHELGHNANAPHTHCIPLSSAQQSAYGVGDRPYVDLCYGLECYIGKPALPPERGTIMSYCHDLADSPFPPTRYRFWKAGEPNELIAGYFAKGLNDGVGNLDATITVQSNLSCSAGRAASVPANPGAIISWEIKGGIITSGAATNSVTFTPTATSVTLTATVKSTRGCSITTSTTVPSNCAAASRRRAS